MNELALPVGQRHEIPYTAAERLWRPAPDCGLPTGAEEGRWLADFIVATWEELGPPPARQRSGPERCLSYFPDSWEDRAIH